LSGADIGLVSVAAACPRCSTAAGMSRWCGTCGLDLRSDLPPVDILESRMAEKQQRRWLAANPGAVAVAVPPAPQVAQPPAAFMPGPENVVAPPPPPPAPPAAARPYAPLRMWSLLAIRWLWFALALGVVALGVDLMWLQEQASPDWTIDELLSITELVDLATIVQLVGYVIGAVIFIFWFHRAYSNLPALGVTKPRHGRGWAIGAWFIPIANLFIPKQLANDVWRAGDPELRPGDFGWQSRPVAAIVHWWWALFLVSGVLANRAGQLMENSANLGDLRSAVIADALAQAIGIASAVAAIVVVKRATARQETRARLLQLQAAA
jgi:eukaryotic-like serine/threonine-protein kinase